MQKVLRATSYCTESYSAWSRACDPSMFPPEKIYTDSSLEGEYMLDGMFVFFICSWSLFGLFLHPFPCLLCSLYDKSFLSLRCSVWSPSPIYIPALHLIPPFLFFLSLCCSSPASCLSALYPVAEGFRLGLSSVCGKVVLQLAACPTRGLSLLGRATHTSAPPLHQLRHNALAGSQLLDRHRKVNSSEGTRQFHVVKFTGKYETAVLGGVCIPKIFAFLYELFLFSKDK